MKYLEYNTLMRKSLHLISTYHDDKEKGLYFVKTIDKLKKTTTNFEGLALEKDSRNNPIKVLIKKNGNPYQLRLITISYE